MTHTNQPNITPTSTVQPASQDDFAPLTKSSVLAPDLVGFGAPIGRIVRDGAHWRPKESFARVRRALRTLTRETEREIQLVNDFLDGAPFPSRSVVDEYAGVTSIMWIAMILAGLEEDFARHQNLSYCERSDLAAGAGSLAQEIVERAVAGDAGEAGGPLAARVLIASLVSTLLGVDAPQEK